MMKFRTPNRWLTALLALGLALVLAVGAGADDQRKKKRKNNKPKEQQASSESAQPKDDPIPFAVDRLERKLLACDATGARSDLGGGGSRAAELVAEGRVLELEGNYDQAEKTLREAADLAPEEPAPWLHLGETHQHARRDGDARSAFSKAADLARAQIDEDSGDEAEAWYYLGAAQQHLGQLDAAYKSLEEARAGASNDPRVHYRLGLTRVYQERWEEGIAHLDRALELHSDLAYAYYYRGQAAGKAGNKSLLIEDLNRFLALAPDAPEAPIAKRVLQSVGR